MRKHAFVMIRYSVLSKGRSKSWVVGKKGFDEYRKELFHPERLKARQELFEKITLPSLVHQTKRPSKEWLTVYILVSEEMPKEDLESLERVVAEHDWISIVKIPVENTQINAPLIDELNRTDNELCYASVRLDDDDALANTYFENLFKYIDKPFAGFLVSFGKGVAGIVDNGELCDFKDYYYPKSAQGLAFIQYKAVNRLNNCVSVYDTGMHTKADLNYPVIVDSRRYAFMRTIHQYADTAADAKLGNILRLESLSLSDVKRHFTFYSKPST